MPVVGAPTTSAGCSPSSTSSSTAVESAIEAESHEALWALLSASCRR